MKHPVITKKFDSALHFLEWASNAPRVWQKENCNSRFTDKELSGVSKWCGTENYEEAYKLALYGWADGLKLLKQEMDIAERIIPMARQRKNHYDVAGHYPNPARAAAGDIFNMVSSRRNEINQKPVVKIKTNNSIIADLRAESIMQWGAAVFSYINMLEKNGFSVQLDSVSETSSAESIYYENCPHISFQFRLKNVGERLSLISSVFWWAHPSALRRIMFSAMERLDIEKLYKGYYGFPAHVSETPSDTLYLNIEDSGDDIEASLRNIRNKHAELMQGNNQPLELLPEIN